MRRSLRTVLSFLIVCLASSYAVAQPESIPGKTIFFDQLKESQSLSQSSINCVLQDREGFLWIGTWSGLIRYDGYKTTVFHSEDKPGKIHSNKILTIYEDHAGYLWIGTHMGGLFRYDKRRNTFDNYLNNPGDTASLSNNNVWAIQEDRNKDLWIGTEQGLNVMHADAKGFERVSTTNTPTLSQNFITSMHLSSTGDLWVGTESGLNKLMIREESGRNHYEFKRYLFDQQNPNYYLNNYIYDIDELKIEGKTTIWLSTLRGLVGLEDEIMTSYVVPGKPLSSSFFRSLLTVGGTKPFIIAGSEMGISLFDPATRKFKADFVHPQSGLSHNTITSLYMDAGGVLWVGTKKGLNKYDSYAKDFKSFSTTEFDKSKNIITGVQALMNNNYLVSTIGGGLFRFDGKDAFKRIKLLTSDEPYYTDFVQTIHSDGKGNIWVGTAGAGVYNFNERDIDRDGVVKKYTHYSMKSADPLSDDYVMSFAEDQDKNIWVGLWRGGLNKISPDGKVTQIGNSLLTQAPIVVLHPDHTGTLWVGSRGNGFYRIKESNDGIKVKHYLSDSTSKNSISNNFVNAIVEDHAGTLWIGTDEGLDSFDRRTEKFSQYNIEGGPSNKVIVSILEDNSGKLWLAHWNGLTVIDPADSVWMRNYDRNDRIMGGFLYNNVCVKNDDGDLIFAGSEGFNLIDTETIVTKPIQYPLAITQFDLFGKPVSFGEEINGRVLLDSPLVHNSNVVLKHFENSIAFEFSSLNYAAPEKIRYAYMLEGFSNEWNYTTSTRRFANYTNLSPGSYTFKVKATSTDGVWNDASDQVFITVQPPWWKMSWARVLYVVVTLMVLFVFRRFILLRANLIHSIKLERLQRENMEKLNKAKLQFFTNISHEFRTPLTLILGPAQSLLDLSDASKIQRSYALSISNNAQRLLRLVNQLLDFRKAESGNLKLSVSEGNIVSFTKEIKLSFDGLAEKLNVNFSLESSSPVLKLWFDRDQFEKIVFNLLSNAFKHTPEGGSITIKLQEAGESILLTIEDTGKGIKGENFENIFRTFFSYDDDKNHMGTGIGLALTKSLVDMHRGTIAVQSQEGVFTRFVITLKKGNGHFQAEEIQHLSGDIETLDHYPALVSDEASVSDSVSDNVLKPTGEFENTLLIVEDNEGVRNYIRSIFEDRYTILEAANGKEGMNLAIENSPDLIISDAMMPVMDGITLCKKIKSDIKTSHIPVILLTARTSLIFKVEGLETGADDYVTKPFNPKVLELKVKNFIALRDRIRKMFQDNDVLNIEPRQVRLTSADEVFVEQIVQSIERNMSNPDFTVEDLGRDVGMSKTQLYRKLKALTNQSANEFIRTMRLKRAAQLLSQNQMTVAQVTYEVGFIDLPYFRECFKKMFGVTPSEYGGQIGETHQ
jgi:signal transduction histidine kinase/ligand-binding sensor domain-containing protein/DNA-binding response OmpR family regulator